MSERLRDEQLDWILKRDGYSEVGPSEEPVEVRVLIEEIKASRAALAAAPDAIERLRAALTAIEDGFYNCSVGHGRSDHSGGYICDLLMNTRLLAIEALQASPERPAGDLVTPRGVAASFRHLIEPQQTPVSTEPADEPPLGA